MFCFKSTSCVRWQARFRHTPAWRSTSAGRWTGRPGWSHRSTPSTSALEARSPSPLPSRAQWPTILWSSDLLCLETKDLYNVTTDSSVDIWLLYLETRELCNVTTDSSVDIWPLCLSTGDAMKRQHVIKQ